MFSLIYALFRVFSLSDIKIKENGALKAGLPRSDAGFIFDSGKKRLPNSRFI